MDRTLIGGTEAARILGISRSTVNRRAAKGSLPVVSKLPGRLGNYLFDKDDILTMAAKEAQK
ncbi:MULTISPECIES: helix-turn-helix domain-containing protein [Corynebacterium]|uniref:Helix-turn-helix domain-containing protein n=1 Tax=Corynebacterium hadale TaxID=2026255 RepID=A0A269PHP1_9CORY|nr:hypothetical protein CIG21_01755 [Corynebacterium hadale]WKC60806.1 Helix-turn-helix domain protein [Corynebacterium hadale]